ncbi:MAG: amidohydrolase family protein [Candidatus Aminicenantes bacterium]|nr:amidohydrolase family protein [Candidatus Aminicenantes bacterium]
MKARKDILPRPFLNLLFALLLMAVAWVNLDAQKTSNVTAIKNVRIFDGAKIIPAGTVLISGGKIAACGANVVIPAGAEVIEAAGKTLLPGLIDAHVHVWSLDQLRQALVFGVTTVVDMFMDAKTMKDIKTTQAEGKARDMAYLISAGTLATAPGGHGTQMGLAIPTLTGPAQAAGFVEARVADGSDFIKIIQDDWTIYGLLRPTLSNEIVAALIGAAHKKGKIAVIHAASLKNCEDALNAGVDGLAHLFFDNASDPGFGKLVSSKKAFVIPTFSVLRTLAGMYDAGSMAQDADLVPYLKPNDVQSLKGSYSFKTSEANYAAAEKALRLLKDAGVTIIAGTDSPNPGTLFGASLHRELVLMTKAGLTPIEALTAATSAAADRFEIQGRGHIKEGYAADLLLVNGDPSVDITATRKIEGIWKEGIRVNREAWREEVAGVKAKVERMKQAPAPEYSESGWISDFEGDKIASNFGAGWMGSTDAFAGGKSKAQFERVSDGAEGSKGAMQITGEIIPGAAITWAGVLFSPGKTTMAPANISFKKAISFWAKGEGKTFAVMIFSQGMGFVPAAKTFTVGPEWKEYTFSFEEFGVLSFEIMGIFIGASNDPGKFALTIDNVRLK